MPLDTDGIVDRRRLKRRLALWRIAAIVSVVVMIAALIMRSPQLPGIKYIAVLWVDGLILADTYRESAVRSLVDDDAATALIVQIDSPGGTTYGSESLYRALREVAAVKPVVAVMNGVAASGGYMVALAADYIVARETTLTGSIGVVMEATNFAGLMEKLGIENEAIKSGPLKAEPNPFTRMSPEAREATHDVVAEVHDMFVGLVADRRGMARQKAEDLADGRIFAGTMAQSAGLIDGLGGERQALEWLEVSRGIDPDMPLKDVEIDYPRAFIAQLVSMAIGNSHFTERLKLDGLLSVWHPSASD